MSVVDDKIRSIDCELDRIHGVTIAAASRSDDHEDGLFDEDERFRLLRVAPSARVNELQTIIQALSTTSSNSPVLSPWRISMLLDRAALADRFLEMGTQQEAEEQYGAVSGYEAELEWLLVGKATIQIYGLMLNALLEETIPLSDDIWYWDGVLGSHTYTLLYAVQTSPLRLWDWTNDIYRDTRRRFSQLRSGNHGQDADEEGTVTANLRMSLAEQWKQFYALLRESIRDRSIIDIQKRIFSPLALCRSEARHHQAHLRRLRQVSASGLGILMDEGLCFNIDHDDSVRSDGVDSREWQGVVERSIALMATVVRTVTSQEILETGLHNFEDKVFAAVADDPDVSPQAEEMATRPAKLSRRLQYILDYQIPSHISTSREIASAYGRPSRLIRYWLPATALLLSSTTILRLITHNKENIINFIHNIGATTHDFFINWVISPTKKVIATIRHDKESEVAIMSRASLQGDRESLERMVVDFALDNKTAPVNEAQISEIRAKVQEGDLTTVLRAYEKELAHPFHGAIRGDLIRALLIQVQKTKVDVEVALSGIDSLLKSQELVFGFVGLTPGILVSFYVFRYLASLPILTGRANREGERRRGVALRILRNTDRIFWGRITRGAEAGILGYMDHGLLLCEVHQLRRIVVEKGGAKGMGSEVMREFLEDVTDLCDIGIGVEKQIKILERIRWAYGKWLC